MTRFPLRPALAAILSATLLSLCLSSCKKEEPEDPVSAVNLTASVGVPQALLDVADVTVTFRTQDNLVTQAVDGPDWSFVFPLSGRTEITGVYPVYFDVSLKGKAVEKGEPINAAVTVDMTFDTVFESGATERFGSFSNKNGARIIWISSTGKYGSLTPLDFSWRGELSPEPDSPAKYSIKELNR